MANNIAISIGDINGIGPEVVIKSLLEIDLDRSTPIIISPKYIVDFYCTILNINLNAEIITKPDEVTPNKINILNIECEEIEIARALKAQVVEQLPCNLSSSALNGVKTEMHKLW